MTILTGSNREIEYILRLEFPMYSVLLPASPVPHHSNLLIPITPEEEIRRNEIRRQIDHRRIQLKAMKSTAPEEFAELFGNSVRKKTQEEEARRFFNQPQARADFAYWAKLDYWTTEEGVALCFGRSPKIVNRKSIEPERAASPFARQFIDTLEIAARARAMNQIHDSNIPGFFIAWTKRMELPFPAELEALVGKRGPILDWCAHSEQWQEISQKWQAAHGEAKARIAELERELATARAALPTHWPWGVYETAKLRKLAEAVRKFWVNYDPAEPDTAPTNPQVAKWLEEQGESPNLAEAMATILRADNLKTGRRRK